jgi:hypothetical protein
MTWFVLGLIAAVVLADAARRRRRFNRRLDEARLDAARALSGYADVVGTSEPQYDILRQIR